MKTIHRLSITVLVALTVLRFGSLADAAVCNANDKQALLSFKSEFNDPGQLLGSWKLNTDCCTWQGVTCNAAGRVATLYVGAVGNARLRVKVGVRGPAKSIGALTELTSLTFFDGVQFAYAHTIPLQFGNLKKLLTLSMYQTQFCGPIPSDLGRLVKLTDLLLAGNRFTGGIPDSFGSLVALKTLILTNNALTTIGSQRITLLKNLQTFVLNDNKLSGPIPKWLGKLTIGDNLELGKNAFTGPIPGELCNIKGLQRLIIYNTKVTSIPAQIGNCATLTELELPFNKLSGSLPKQLGRCLSLFKLNIYGNMMSGSLPREIGDLQQLQDVNIASNRFSGTIPSNWGPFQDDEFVSFTDFTNNRLTGPIPQSMSNLRAAVFRPGNPGLCGTPLPACK